MASEQAHGGPYCGSVPEGDSLHRATERLRALEGEVVAVESPNPRAPRAIAARLDGLRLERVDAVAKNLVLTFEGGLILRSHLRMRGRWDVQQAGARIAGRPWVVLRGRSRQAVLWHGPVLELGRNRVLGLGPDIMAEQPDFDAMVRRLRAADEGVEIGAALLDQRLVSGIGNLWRAEALFVAKASPWQPLGDLDDGEVNRLLRVAHQLMTSPRQSRAVYRRAGRPCRDCGTLISSRAQGENARTAYWCPRCQGGTGPQRA